MNGIRNRDGRTTVDFVIQRLGLKTAPVAYVARGVSAITAEQNADMHFVSLALKPAKKSTHAVPAIVFVIIVAVIARSLLTFDYEILIGLR